MKILVAVDSHPYSAHVALEVGKLAVNTWADITFMGVPDACDDDSTEMETLKQRLQEYREVVLDVYAKEDVCPYSRGVVDGWRRTEEGLTYGGENGSMKALRLLIGHGATAKEILTRSQQEGSDLIVISCDKKLECGWRSGPIPLRVAQDASCSVLVVKEAKEPEQIVCCLDHRCITQYSLEMINQLVTLYQAELKIVGITDSEALKSSVEAEMKHLLEYYSTLGLTPWLEVVDGSILPSFIARESQRNLVALWANPTSLLSRFFPKKRISSFIQDSPSSVLLLR